MKKFLFLAAVLLTAVFSTRATEVTPPASATYEYYTAKTYTYITFDEREWQATIAIDGDKMYIKNVLPFLINPKWIEGTIDNGVVTFAAGQVIGDLDMSLVDDPELTSTDVYPDLKYYGLSFSADTWWAREDATFSWDASTKTLKLTNYESGAAYANDPADVVYIPTDGTSDPSFTLTFKGTVAPTPSTVTISANQDPQEADAYYTTYYNGTVSYQVDANTTIYQAILNSENTAINLAAASENIIPAETAVILKSSSNEIVLTPATDPVTTTDYTENALRGVDAATAVSTLGAGTIYTLAAEDNVMAFYQYVGTEVHANKAYLQLPVGVRAPRRITFGANTATGVESTAATIKAEKILRDGQFYIIKNGNLYNVQGALVK